MTVSLPDAGDGSRRRRRDERRKRRRWRPVLGWVALALVIAGLVGAAIVLLTGDDGDGDEVVAEDDAAPAVEASAPAGGGPALLVVTDPAGGVVGVTVFQPETSTVLHVPPGTLVEVASLGLVPLREAAESGGADLLAHSLENLLGVRFDEVASVTTADLAALADGTTVPVEGGDEVVVDAETIDALLADVGDGTSLERIVRHQAFWTAYLGADLDSPVDAAGELGPDAVQWVLPVETIAGLAGEDELFRVVEDDVDELVARVFPDDAAGDDERVRVRILNGAGAPGVAQDVQPLLIEAGGEMTLSGNADRFDYATTQVVYYDDADRDAAEAIREAIGVGEVVKSVDPLDVVDVTVVVGTDFLATQPEG
jgi:hypothetical protein